MGEADAERLLAKLRFLADQRGAASASVDSIYAEQIDTFERLIALGVTHERIAEAAGVARQAVGLAVAKRRRQQATQ